MKLNVLKLSHLVRPRTHEGAPAVAVSPELALRRSVLACMLWEDEFYEDGVAIAGRIREVVPKVEAAKVAALAVEARTAMKLRHTPLLLVREMARHATHRALVAETMTRVIQRSDELAEFVAIYWKDGRAPLSGQVKKGLAAAFPKFDEYALAKYDRPGVVRLRDVLSRRRCGSGWSMVSWRLPIPGRWHSPRVAISVRIGSDCSQSASLEHWRCCATFAT
jgi:60 kDa SS-A/Ro ribonucleoprotein